MLGLLPGASFDEYVAAALADVPLRSARAMLEDLLDAHLVQQPTAGRYRLHDLVHQHARRAAAEQDSPAERERALGRVLDYYVHAAAAADAAMPFLSPGRPASAGRPPAELPRFTDKNAALAWLVTEYANLMAAFETAVAVGADVHVCELPRFMRAYFARRCGTTHLNVLFERSLAAAQRLGDPLQLAEAHSDLGFARYNAGRMAEAGAAYEAAEPLVVPGRGHPVRGRTGHAPRLSEVGRGAMSRSRSNSSGWRGSCTRTPAARRARPMRPRRRPGRCCSWDTARRRRSGPGRCWASRTPTPHGRPR